mmetsp:Transcript_79870/g.229274  ORF Transcript_79870/g.229274 Transcript_79870/m.229274 type:complete len:351 (-) Transcript_79870:158-1210(-)
MPTTHWAVSSMRMLLRFSPFHWPSSRTKAPFNSPPSFFNSFSPTLAAAGEGSVEAASESPLWANESWKRSTSFSASLRRELTNSAASSPGFRSSGATPCSGPQVYDVVTFRAGANCRQRLVYSMIEAANFFLRAFFFSRCQVSTVACAPEKLHDCGFSENFACKYASNPRLKSWSSSAHEESLRIMVEIRTNDSQRIEFMWKEAWAQALWGQAFSMEANQAWAVSKNLGSERALPHCTTASVAAACRGTITSKLPEPTDVSLIQTSMPFPIGSIDRFTPKPGMTVSRLTSSCFNSLRMPGLWASATPGASQRAESAWSLWMTQCATESRSVSMSASHFARQVEPVRRSSS